MYQLTKGALTYFNYPVDRIFRELDDIKYIILCYAKTRAEFDNQSEDDVLVEIIQHFWNTQTEHDKPDYVDNFVASSLSILKTPMANDEKLNVLSGITDYLFCVHPMKIIGTQTCNK